MRASLVINGHEMCDYIPEGGLSFNTEDRVTKELTTMDGTLFKKTVTKRTISITLVDCLMDQHFTRICGYLNPNPASVTYKDFNTGETLSGTFYVAKPNYSVKKSIGQISIISGGSIELVEK